MESSRKDVTLDEAVEALKGHGVGQAPLDVQSPTTMAAVGLVERKSISY